MARQPQNHFRAGRLAGVKIAWRRNALAKLTSGAAFAADAAAPAIIVIERISAVTLGTTDMARSVKFYRTLGFSVRSGGEDADFTTFDAGATSLNLIAGEMAGRARWWGRVIFYVADVDALYALASLMALKPHAPPEDGPWGERYFHITDPDGHELSFARPLEK
jgi:catechol 2,3-dioxygenase-like lactoylglutathione lyase family enzyme